MADAALARAQLFALRETIARLEGKPAPAIEAARRQALAEAVSHDQDRSKRERLALGLTDLDEALDGGLPLDAVTEIRTDRFRDAGAGIGFVLAIIALADAQLEHSRTSCPILWITDRISSLEAGFPYVVGLQQTYGLHPARFFHARARHIEEALWISEAALEGGVFQSTVLEVAGNPKNFGLTESRRLSLRAKQASKPIFLLRQAGEEEAGSTQFRFLLSPMPSSLRPLPNGALLQGSIGHPLFRVILEKSRNPAPLSFILEWSSHDRRFLAHRPSSMSAFPEERTTYPGSRLSASGDRQDMPRTMGSVVALDRTA